MLERVDVEVGAELGVAHRQHVLVELGGDPARVVVRGDQAGDRLHEVGAEEEAVVEVHVAVEVDEEPLPLLRREVPDRAAEERDESAPYGAATSGAPSLLRVVRTGGPHLRISARLSVARDRVEVMVEVADDRAYVDAVAACDV